LATSVLPPPERWPHHIAIIMDGNGRWAQARRRPRSFGHRAGVRAVRKAVEFCLRHKVGALTLFAFSSENWARPASEVNALMGLFLRALEREVDELHTNGVRLHFIGDVAAFPAELAQRMHGSEQKTAANTALVLSIAVNYGGRWDIVQAAQRIAAAAASGALSPLSITADTVRAHLSLSQLPDPDLFIRTGGDHRISNFLLWQIAYSELYFSDTLWPDFDHRHLEDAVRDFARRERRFGKTSAQVQAES
jgi:undecaprenyl diphosphate synthase